MRWSTLFKAYVAFVVSILSPTTAQAAMTPIQSRPLSLNAIQLPRDASPPGGTYTGTSTSDNWSLNEQTCPITRTVTITGTLVTGSSDVYQTSQPGVGVRFMISPGITGIAAPIVSPITFTPVLNQSYNLQRRADVVLAAGVVPSGALTGLPSMNVKFEGDCISTMETNSTITNRTFTTTQCGIATNSPSVTLPSINTSDLPSIESTYGNTSFELMLSCNRSFQGITAEIYMTITDVNDISNRTSYLSLSNESSASGVALQILNIQSPISFGMDSSSKGNQNQFHIGNNLGDANGIKMIPLSVRYIRTGELIPGTVKAAATFTMSYQ